MHDIYIDVMSSIFWEEKHTEGGGVKADLTLLDARKKKLSAHKLKTRTNLRVLARHSSMYGFPQKVSAFFCIHN
jgi:hypothetical protein